VQRDSVVATRVQAGQATYITVSVPVAIHNADAQPVTFFYCASHIQARTGGEWDAVLVPVCSGSGTTLEIAPGDTRHFSFSVTESIAAGALPRWGSATIDGIYRLRVGLLHASRYGHIPLVASNTFVVTEPD
jgi:hypothetical protein